MPFKKFIYDGPIFLFNKMVVPKWYVETYALTEARALSNFKFRAKMVFGYSKTAKIDLPAKIKVADE